MKILKECDKVRIQISPINKSGQIMRGVRTITLYETNKESLPYLYKEILNLLNKLKDKEK